MNLQLLPSSYWVNIWDRKAAGVPKPSQGIPRTFLREKAKKGGRIQENSIQNVAPVKGMKISLLDGL